jgi:uncharacterized protein (DUF433 family)/anti-anti-sigma regulatory factor
MAIKYYVDDDETAFSVKEEEEFFRLKILRSEIDEDDVEDFLDTTVEWLSSNPAKGILIDFSGVRAVCPGFVVELQRNYEEIKSQGLYVRFVNVDPALEPYIDVQNITVVMSVYPEKPVVSAKAVLTDLANNLTDEELMKKHGLSPKGLRSLYKKLLRKGLIAKHVMTRKVVPVPPPVKPPDDTEGKKPAVNASDVLKDIENGATEEDLMRKYRLSRKGVQSLMRKLRGAGLVNTQIISSIGNRGRR